MTNGQRTSRTGAEQAERPTPAEQVSRLYDQAEVSAAKAVERLVSRDSFGELLAKFTENAIALARIGSDTMDLVVRNLRVAGRADVARLGRQLARTEDKLEQVLQEVERLQDLLERHGIPAGEPVAAERAGREGLGRNGASTRRRG